MRSGEVLRALRADGWKVVRQKGSHVQLRHPTKPGDGPPSGERHAFGHAEEHREASGTRIETVSSMTTYVALIHKDADSDYGVSFPDLPGCVTAGSTIDEAMAMAREALALHIEGLLEDGEEVPSPTPPDAIDRDGAVAIAAIDVPDNTKVERVNITVPALSLQRFDAFAARRGMTRSGLFVEAVHRWIQATTLGNGQLHRGKGKKD